MDHHTTVRSSGTQVGSSSSSSSSSSSPSGGNEGEFAPSPLGDDESTSAVMDAEDTCECGGSLEHADVYTTDDYVVTRVSGPSSVCVVCSHRFCFY